MIKISFIGDIMLGRYVGAKYSEKPYTLVSEALSADIASSDLCVANLESPITNIGDDDSLKFGGNSDTLYQFKWVDCFSLSNNHINDFGTQGMHDTIDSLNKAGIQYNGLFKESYNPFKYEKGEEKIAVVTCTDMMNIEFDDNCPYHTLRVNDPDSVSKAIQKSKEQGFFTILFAHIGMLFSRFPNPSSRSFIHQMIDDGADCVVTAHSHCLGCHEEYKGVHIFHSLGDFLMDGSSFRRRRACCLELMVEEKKLQNWRIIPTQTNMELQVVLPDEKTTKRMLEEYNEASILLSHSGDNYKAFYNKQYRKDMLSHSLSTLHFEYKKRGVGGLLHILRIRIYDVLGMVKRVVTDRSNMSYDTDGVDTKHKMSNKDIQ